jgi:hypothetical protein
MVFTLQLVKLKMFSSNVALDEVVITRCRKGHSRITQLFLLERDLSEFVFGQCQHIITECGNTALIRNYFHTKSERSFYKYSCKVLGFLHETGFYQKF